MDFNSANNTVHFAIEYFAVRYALAREILSEAQKEWITIKVLQIVLNEFTNDARVLRASKLGMEMGNDVYVYALYRAGLPKRELCDNIEVRRFRLVTRPLSRAACSDHKIFRGNYTHGLAGINLGRTWCTQTT